MQQIEIESVWRDDHDFAVNHGSGWKLLCESVMKLGKVPIQRTEITTLNVDVGAAAKHNRSEPVPFRLIQEPTVGRKLVGKLREHGFDWGLDGKCHK